MPSYAILFPMFVLGIETTCDETAAAIVEDGGKILSNVIYSQADLHKKYGGVFPELASRRHSEIIIPVIDEAIRKANISPKDIGLIAVASGPGLIGALFIGLNTAKALSLAWEIPFIGVNHVEAHLYAAMMGGKEYSKSLGAVLSGGHTFLVEMQGLGNYRLVGTTVDDAVGEAFDKVATLLGLPYPGGPNIEKLATLGDPKRYSFPTGKVKRSPLDFSFSGLKTSVLYAVKGQSAKKDSPNVLGDEEKAHIAASFQQAAFTDIVGKTLLAAKNLGAEAIFLGGGVCLNKRLRAMFHEKAPNMPFYWPDPELCTDNAAMIAGLGFQKFIANASGDSFALEAMTRIPLE